MKPFLVFDAYGTLLELDDFYGRLQRGFAGVRAKLPLDDVRSAARAEMLHYIAHAREARNEASWLRLHRECADVILHELHSAGHPLDLTTESADAVLAEAVVFKPYAEVDDVLTALSLRGVRLAVASNWDYQLPAILQQHNLARHFEWVLTSAAIGFEKPSAFFFEAVRAAATASGHRGDLAYIGDNYEKDVMPSAAAGFQPHWLVRDQRDVASGEATGATRGTPQLRTLRDLLTSLSCSEPEEISLPVRPRAEVHRPLPF